MKIDDKIHEFKTDLEYIYDIEFEESDVNRYLSWFRDTRDSVCSGCEGKNNLFRIINEDGFEVYWCEDCLSDIKDYFKERVK